MGFKDKLGEGEFSGSAASKAWDWLKSANVKSSKAKAGTKVKGGDRFAGTTSDSIVAPNGPEKGKKITTPKPKAKVAMKAPSRKPKMAAPKKASGKFNFGAEIARGFGGETAWEREKKKAGVKD